MTRPLNHLPRSSKNLKRVKSPPRTLYWPCASLVLATYSPSSPRRPSTFGRQRYFHDSLYFARALLTITADRNSCRCRPIRVLPPSLRRERRPLPPPRLCNSSRPHDPRLPYHIFAGNGRRVSCLPTTFSQLSQCPAPETKLGGWAARLNS